ncbi:hypothetical protein PL81_34755, partial [Streptomyces sp. RSD-27]
MSESLADVIEVAGSELRFLRKLLGDAGENAWERLLEWFIDDWFRLDVLGLENIPAEGPAVLVSNHSGAWGLDAFVLQKVLLRSLRRRLHVLTGERSGEVGPGLPGGEGGVGEQHGGGDEEFGVGTVGGRSRGAGVGNSGGFTGAGGGGGPTTFCGTP